MIPTSALAKFRASLRGQSFCLGEAGYDAARAVPNAMIDRRPVLVARCAGAADVSVQTTERYLGCKQRIRSAVNDRIGIEPNP
jgi:hypothetical protein